MESFLAWMNFSEGERRRLMDAIDALRNTDSRDELGVGVIRDGLADLLFPGTGTVQTRVRYFLFIPWIYRALEVRDPAETPRLARASEIALIDGLEAGGENVGIIGVDARKTLKRLPSSIYWLGLRRWGLFRHAAGQEEFHRSLARRKGRWQAIRADDGDVAGGSADSAWHSGLPEAPPDFPRRVSFKLTKEEAEYLRDRVIVSAHESLLARLIQSEAPKATVEFPWEHPFLADLPLELREQLQEAKTFSETIHGAAILYNLLLAEKSGNAAREDQHRAALDEWAAARRAQGPDPGDAWPGPRLWRLVEGKGSGVRERTRLFVERWSAHASQVAAGGEPDAQPARELIVRREHEVKGRQRARLHDPSALSRWNGAAGLKRLDFRWGITQAMLEEIHGGLRAGHAGA